MARYTAKWRSKNLYQTYYAVDLSTFKPFMVEASNIQGALRKISRRYKCFELTKDPNNQNQYIPKLPKRMQTKHLSKYKASYEVYDEESVPEQIKLACIKSALTIS